MKKVPLLFLLLVTTFVFVARAREKYTVKTYYNYSDKNLLGMLVKAKADTEKLNILNSLINYSPDADDPGNIDTGYIHKLLNLNARVKLINDKPYQTLLIALRANSKKNYLQELPLMQTAIEQFDAEHIDATCLLIEMRWLFTVVKKQEEKFKYYSEKLPAYLQQKQYVNAAACYHAIAGYYLTKGDYNSAINNYLKAGELFKTVSHFWYVNEILVVGNEYNDWGNHDIAITYLKKGLKLIDTKVVNENLPFALGTLSINEYDTKNFRESLKYAGKMKQYLGNDTLDRTNVAVMQALDLIALDRMKEARLYLDTITQAGQVNEFARIRSSGFYIPEYAFFKYYATLHDFPNAEKYLQAAYRQSVASNTAGLTMKFLPEFAQFYADRGNMAQAWYYTTIYNKMNDSLQAKTSKFKIASYENEQKENAQNIRLAGLQQQQAIQEATISQRNTIIWLSLLGLLAVCGSLVFIYRQLQVNKKTLLSLRQTQTQLVQSEKMASLGELTAGIAHEIQNPLNFVNNFSEVSMELVDEMQNELNNGDKDEAIAISEDIKQNLEKIRHHGKRADFIVKGMLQHSRTSTGEKQPTDINILADEFLKLSYHGLRAKDKSFNAELVTNFDESLPKVNIAQQDIGRVLLNLFNNAFYAVNQKQKTVGGDYKPEVTVSTSTDKGSLVISVRDNGNGIPDAIKEKIMQPFFTTKPTGEGTGLGLSLSYDIVVKGHGGKIDVDSKEGEFTLFTVTLPAG